MPATSISDLDLRAGVQRMANYSAPNTIRPWFERSNTGGRHFRYAANNLIYPGRVYGIGIRTSAIHDQISGASLAAPYPEVPDNHALLVSSAKIRADGCLVASIYRWTKAGQWRNIGGLVVQPARVRQLGLMVGEPPAPPPKKRSKAKRAPTKTGKRPAVKKKRRTPERRNVPDSSEAADGMPPVRPDPPFIPDDMDPEGFSGAETAGISGAALVIGGLLAAAFFAGK